MKISVKMTLSALLSITAALPAHAMENDAQDSPLCQLPANVINEIATACNRCDECGDKDCEHSTPVLNWKDLWNVQQTCRFLHDNFNPARKDIVIDLSGKRGENEPIDAFIAQILTQLVKVSKYHNKTHKIVIKLCNNNLSDALSENNSLLSRLFVIINNMGLASRISTIDLGNNNLTDIPDSLLLLANLTNLELLENNLSDEAVAKVFTIASLKNLGLSHNHLQHLPDAIGCTKLKSLDLAHNVLPPAELAKLGVLKATLADIELSNNHLTEIPGVVPTLENLTSLDLDDNEISHRELPKLKSLQKLEALFLRNNNITHIPEVLLMLPHLDELDLSHNALDASEIRKLCTITTLKILDLDSIGLQIIPAEIKCLSKLWALSVANNQLTPPEIEKICSIQSLTDLDISDNGLTDLPVQLGNLRKLKTLDVNFNFIAEDVLATILSLLPRNCEIDAERPEEAQQ